MGENLRGRHAVHAQSRRDDWETPPDLFAALDAEFAFDTDVAASESNRLCLSYFTKEVDALSIDWGHRRCWMNPPYGREIRAWMAKALDASRKGALVVALVPARTDTRWWHESAMLATERRFIQGRLRFRCGGVPIGDNSKGSAKSPFPSAIVIFQP